MAPVPLYCPHWGKGCSWSADSDSKPHRRFLEAHLRIVHREQPPPVKKGPSEPARPVPADRIPSGPPKRGGKPTPTDEQVSRALLRAAEQLGHSPSSGWWAKNVRSPSLSFIQRRHHNWNNALASVGLPTRPASPA